MSETTGTKTQWHSPSHTSQKEGNIAVKELAASIAKESGHEEANCYELVGYPTS